MNRYFFYALLVAGIAFRVFLLMHYDLVNGGEVDVYLADEGVVGLMGKHILEGRELPVFFYGQDYLGALEAYCVALSFAIFGVGLSSLRLVPFLFSLAVLGLVYRFAYVAYSVAAARWATALVAVAPMYFLQWNLKARGGFVEHVVLVLAVLVVFRRFYFEHDRRRRTALALGLLAGVSLWVNQLVVGYLLILGFLLVLASDRRRLALTAVSLVLGASLLIGYNVAHPFATVRALARKAVVLNRVPIEERGKQWVLRGIEKRIDAVSHGLGKLGLVFAVPPAGEIERLGLSDDARRGGRLTQVRGALWVVPAAVFGVALLAALPRRGPAGWEPFGAGHLIVLLSVITFVIGYVSPRYMLPAYPLAAIAVGALATRLAGGRRGTVVAAGIVAVLAYNAASWADVTDGAGEEAQAGANLLEFLQSRGLDRCYSAAPLYHVVFQSGERVLLVPLQKDRYPSYNAEIENSESVCYVFRDDQRGKRQHVALMRYLEQTEVDYISADVGHYNVLWGFSPREALSASVIREIRRPRDPRIELGSVRAGGTRETWT